jgi:hypothetical protein
LIQQIIPHDYVELIVDDQEKTKSSKEQTDSLYKELNSLRREKDKLTNIVVKNNQNKLKASQFRALALIKKALNNADLEKSKIVLVGQDYEKEISNAASVEEVEAIREEVLFKIIQNSKGYSSDRELFSNKKEKTEHKTSSKNFGDQFLLTSQNDKILKDLIREFSRTNNNYQQSNTSNIQDLEDKLIKTKQKSNKLKNRLHNLQENFNSETKKFSQQIQNLKEQNKFQ